MPKPKPNAQGRLSRAEVGQGHGHGREELRVHLHLPQLLPDGILGDLNRTMRIRRERGELAPPPDRRAEHAEDCVGLGGRDAIRGASDDVAEEEHPEEQLAELDRRDVDVCARCTTTMHNEHEPEERASDLT